MSALFFTLFLICLAFSNAADLYRGVALLTPALPIEPTLTGKVTFDFDPASGDTTVKVLINNVQTNPNGLHGIHVHMYGDLRGLATGAGVNVTGALSAGGHFNPNGAVHGCPDTNSTTWHVGDLGNWQATGGVINQTKVIPSPYVSLMKGASNSVIGRAVVLHETVDDCVNTPSAARRLAYGVIGIANIAAPDANKAGGAADVSQAVCVLQGTVNCSGFCQIGKIGSVLLANDGTAVKITAQIYGLLSERGFHIHEFGDLSLSNGNSAGGHYNPQALSHGLPPSDTRHLGDLGTINAFMMFNAYYQMTPTLTTRSWNVTDVLGRAMIVHQWLDHGLDPTCSKEVGYAAGTAGARVYICVIGVFNPADQSVPGNVLPVPVIPPEITQMPNAWGNVPCVKESLAGSGRALFAQLVVLVVSVVLYICAL